MRNLPSLDAAVHTRRPCAKPAKRQKKARTRINVKPKPRAERDQIAAVRAACVARDGYCRIASDCVWPVDGPRYSCEGPSQLMHMHAKRRSKTRNQAPAVRHDARYALMGCAFHHAEYDAHRLVITAQTRAGANGRLRYRRVQ